jgi:hypothetical protein
VCAAIFQIDVRLEFYMIRPSTMIRRIAMIAIDDRHRSLDAKPRSPAPLFVVTDGKFFLFVHFRSELEGRGAGPAGLCPALDRDHRGWRDS